MDSIEIIVTQADHMPTSSNSSLNRTANISDATLLKSSMRQPLLQKNGNATKIQSSSATTSQSSDAEVNVRQSPSPSAKKVWLATSSSSSNSSNRNNLPSSNNNGSSSHEKKPSIHSQSIASPNSSSSSPSTALFTIGEQPKRFHSMRSLTRSGQQQQSLSVTKKNNLISSPGKLTSSATSPQPLYSLVSPNDSSSFNEYNGSVGKLFSDATSIRSLTSIGMGSTDGKKMIIRRVPQTPAELLSFVNPPVVPETCGEEESFADDESESAHLKPRRQQWSSKMQFVLACIGYSIGLGNVWRFPYLCYRSGGGVFLIPYFIIMFVCGIPMLFMELAVGQYTGRGPIGAFGQLCPLFKGAGMASVIVSFIMSTYYSVIIAYAIYYLFAAFRPEMPWLDCAHRWTTPDCWTPVRSERNFSRPLHPRTPSEEFFENKVLQMSAGLEHPGAMRWDLVACLICAWILIYFAIWKSIKSSAKVRYITATLPFLLIVVFLGRALTLDGAYLGLRYFFRPNWSLLGNANVWINAAAQNFNSLGITFGAMISFASYNKYNNNFLHDTLAVSLVNMITSLLVGIFAFATIGNIAWEQGTSVEDVVSDGPGLIFVVYPQAISKMPLGQMWAVLFFFMLLCLGLNSQFAIVEVVVTSIQDGFPNWIKSKLVYHELLVLLIVCVAFLFGLPNLIQAGIYYFQLIDHYAASISIMFLAFFQIIAISWFYGVERLTRNIKQMTGKAPSFYYRSCWLVAAPLLLFSLWVFSLINYQLPTYDNGDYQYPNWAHALGWCFAVASIICIPIFAIVALIHAQGRNLSERFRNAIQPDIYECRICGEHHCEHDTLDYDDFQELQTILPQTTTPTITLQAPPSGKRTENHVQS